MPPPRPLSRWRWRPCIPLTKSTRTPPHSTAAVEDFTTLSGLAMFLIGRVPKAGDLFSYKNLQFEVVDMDRGRVDKLLVIKKEEEE